MFKKATYINTTEPYIINGDDCKTNDPTNEVDYEWKGGKSGKKSGLFGQGMGSDPADLEYDKDTIYYVQ